MFRQGHVVHTRCHPGGRKAFVMRGIDRNERGTALAEYLFLAALIAVVCLAALTLVGQETDATHSRNASSIVNASQ